MTAPFLKWVGGKSRLVPELVRRLPAKWRTYHEPFAGGAALFFHLADQMPDDDVRHGKGAAMLYDANRDLTTTYLAVRNNVTSVIRYLTRHERNFIDATRTRRRWQYLQTRREFNDSENYEFYAHHHNPWRAAQFIFLNKTCFNGLWRVNRQGKFNVPMGDYKNPVICDRDALRAGAAALAKARVLCTDYHTAELYVDKGDVVYFDPPYDPVSATSSFASYAAAGFDREDQRHLAEVARRMVEKRAFVMLSNSDTPFIRKLYPKKHFCVDRVMVGRSINSKGSGRGKVGELIITGKRS